MLGFAVLVVCVLLVGCTSVGGPQSPPTAAPSFSQPAPSATSSTSTTPSTPATRPVPTGTGPTPIATATPRPTVSPWPTPACPPTQKGAPTWKLHLEVGPNSAIGLPGSGGFQTCTTGGDVDSGFHDPESGATVMAGARLALTLEGEATLFQIGSASYSAWGTSGESQNPLGTYQPSAGVFEVDAPPPGDWTVVVGASINDVPRGTVTSQAWYFRITVLR